MSWLRRRLIWWETTETSLGYLHDHRYGEVGDHHLDNTSRSLTQKTLATQLNRLMLVLKREDFDDQHDMTDLLNHVRRYPDCLGMANYPDEDGYCNVLQHYIDTGKIELIKQLVQFTVQVAPWFQDAAGGLYLIVDGINHRLLREVDVFFPEMIVRSEVPEHVVLDCFCSLEQYFPREKILEYSLLSASCCARLESLFFFFLDIVGYHALFRPTTMKDKVHGTIEDWRYIYEADEESTISDHHDIFDDFAENSYDGGNDDNGDDDDDDNDDGLDANVNEPLLIFLCSLGTDYSELVCSSLVKTLNNVEDLIQILDCIHMSRKDPKWHLEITYYFIRNVPQYFQYYHIQE